MLTIRNWLIGRYIVEYEQKGEDRVKYGDNLMSRLAMQLNNKKGFSERTLRSFREFYNCYQSLEHAILNELLKIGNQELLSNYLTHQCENQIWQKPSAKSELTKNQSVSSCFTTT
jgi:hypothetical protein